jgi:hypothetical protein
MIKEKLLVALIAISALVKSQPYGQITYKHIGTFLSSGNITTNTAGFLMAGFRPATTPGLPNFYIDKTGTGGITTGPNVFMQDYRTFWDNTCAPAGPQNQALNCYGISAIEISLSGPSRSYALAGATDDGVFFATLDNNGVVVDQALYLFPTGISQITKPGLITDGTGTFYLYGSYYTGSYNTMYIICVNSAGAITWQNLYDYGTAGSFIIPKQMISSPYYNELVIVGITDDNNNGCGSEGFFMTVPLTGGNAPIFQHLGQGYNGAVDEFHCICPAYSSVPTSQGFVIGGYSNTGVAGNGTQWLVKLDPSGNLIWTKNYSPSFDNTGTIVAVLERYSSTYGAYDYWAACTSTVGIQVLKVNKNGNAFGMTLPAPSNFNNEFVYNANTMNLSTPNSISEISATGNDEGIHVYGTDDRVNGGNHYFIEAYFNGESGCNPPFQSIELMRSVASVSCSNFSGSKSAGAGPFSACPNFSIYNSPVITITAQVCGGGNFYSGGINYRSSLTELANEQNAGNSISVFPNPVDDKAQISIFATQPGDIKVDVYNSLGQFVSIACEKKIEEGENKIEIDFNSAGLQKGIYFLDVSVDGRNWKEKVILK